MPPAANRSRCTLAIVTVTRMPPPNPATAFIFPASFAKIATSPFAEPPNPLNPAPAAISLLIDDAPFPAWPASSPKPLVASGATATSPTILPVAIRVFLVASLLAPAHSAVLAVRSVNILRSGRSAGSRLSLTAIARSVTALVRRVNWLLRVLSCILAIRSAVPPADFSLASYCRSALPPLASRTEKAGPARSPNIWMSADCRDGSIRVNAAAVSFRISGSGRI